VSLFRPEAIEAKRRRLWGEVRLAQPPSYAVWTIVLCLICSALFAALVFGRYTRKETVQGFLTPEAGVIQVRPAQAGRVARVLVRDGQQVAAGAPLLEFVSDVGASDQAPVLDLQLAEADAQAASLDDRRSAFTQSNTDERNRLEGQIAANVRTRAAMLRQRSAQADALALAEADAERMVRLQAQGYAPNAQVDARRRVVLTERAALADLDTALSTLDAATANLRGQVVALPAKAAETLASLDAERSSLAQRRAELQVVRGYVLRAPVAGIVSSLQARVGLAPASDQPLLSIAPQGSPLEARLLVPTRAAGFLKIGQPARLQIEAFPFQRFGFVEGRIVDISRTVTRPDEAVFPIAMTEPVYEVRVRFSRHYIDAYGERRALQPGMALRADLPIDRRRLWQQLFDPLLAAGKRAAA
jgi:membrane fusion protein